MTDKTTMTDDLAYLWQDQDIYPKRFAKSASALAAIFQVLEEENLFDGADNEVAALHQQCLEFGEELFTEVLQDPSLFAWTVYTFNSLGYVLQTQAEVDDGTTPASELARLKDLFLKQLDFFKAFALGFHAKANQDFRFDTPLLIELPFHIPATELILEGENTADIVGWKDGLPLLMEDGAERTPAIHGENPDHSRLHISKLPLVTYKNCYFQLNPWVGRVPGIALEEVQIAYDNPVRAGDKEIAIVEQAIDLLEQYDPVSLNEFQRWIRCLATKTPLPDGSGGVGSVAFTYLPGVIHLKFSPNPIWMAETFIHECYHQRFFFLDEDTPILQEIPGPAINYSPWRYDSRPAHGLFHAVSVFVPATRFYLRLYQNHQLTDDEREYALGFVIRQFYRLQIGSEVLQRNAVFTPEGEKIFAAVRQSVEDLKNEIIAAKLPEDGQAMTIDRGFASGKFVPMLSRHDQQPLSNLELLLEHMELSDVGNQVEDWKTLIKEKLNSLRLQKTM